MELTHNQKSGLRMISKGFRPKKITVEALFNRRLLDGTIHNPRLNDAGKHVVRHGELP